MRAHGVKLKTAPDAPPWGQVPTCSLSAALRTQQRAVNPMDIRPFPGHRVCQARKASGGAGWRLRWACLTARASGDILAPVPAAEDEVLATGVGPRIAARMRECDGPMRGSAGMTDSTRPGPADEAGHNSGGRNRDRGLTSHPGKDPS